ncbi:MAG: enoyl-CoA hydratase/isomerase family protein [Myxococcaceae bacterium]|nr:enoyl-CoA hydratase/isomerase family protein [Myxococcaceae bacterium]
MTTSDGVALLRMQFGKANAMTAATLDGMEALVSDFERSSARAAVLIGDQRSFSAGLALPSLVSLERPAMKRFIDRFGEVMLRFFACPKPIVAALNGHAIAGGCVLALQCDWRVMVEGDARIGLNETQLGIGLPSSVLEPLRLAVPPASVVPIAYEGRLFTPTEAHALGLVHELVPAAELKARAEAKALALAAVPSTAVAQVKLGLRRGALDAIRARAAEETERWLDTWFSPEAQARLAATVARLSR